jgi:hypothetical protein
MPLEQQPIFARHGTLVASTDTEITITVDAAVITVTNRGNGASPGAADDGDIWARLNGTDIAGAGEDDTYWIPFGASVEISSANPGTDEVVHLWSAGTPAYSVEASRP